MNTFSVTCPSCKHDLEADDDNIGMMVECPLCHQQFEIRRPDTPPPQNEETHPAPQPAAATAPQSGAPMPPQGFAPAPQPGAPMPPQGYAPYAPVPQPGAPMAPQGYAPYAPVPQPGAPMPPQGFAQGYAVPPGYTAPRRAISWMPALVCSSVMLVFWILVTILDFSVDEYYVSESEAALQMICGLGLFVSAILTVVFRMILHYRCWKALPHPFNNVSSMGPVTPGKAVGFLFIPFFNLYWCFPSFAGLGKGWNNWAVATGKVAPTHPMMPPKTPMAALGMAFAVLWLLDLLLSAIPIFGDLLAIAEFVLWIFFYKDVVRYANSPDAWPV